MLSNEIGWFDLEENNTGSLTSALSADATLVRSALSDRLSTIVQNVALTVTACVIAFTLSWRIAAVVVASLPLLVGASIAEVCLCDHHDQHQGDSIISFFISNILTLTVLFFSKSAATISQGVWRRLPCLL